MVPQQEVDRGTVTGARITVLVDNYVRRRGLLAEHGWSCWLVTPNGRVLFDTGQGTALLHNAGALGIPLEAADAIVLSHGHYDHTGSLRDVIDLAPAARVFAHPAAFEAKYACTPDSRSRDIGIPGDRIGLPDRIAERLVPTIAPTTVLPGVLASGQVPRVTEFEDTGGRFHLDARCRQADPLVDDQALFIRTSEGTIVLLGCAHAGVINTLRYAKQMTNGAPVRAVIGGMHLGSASRARIERTIEELKRLDVSQIVPAHCTGMNAFAALWNGLPERCTVSEAGATVAWEVETHATTR